MRVVASRSRSIDVPQELALIGPGTGFRKIEGVLNLPFYFLRYALGFVFRQHLPQPLDLIGLSPRLQLFKPAVTEGIIVPGTHMLAPTIGQAFHEDRSGSFADSTCRAKGGLVNRKDVLILDSMCRDAVCRHTLAKPRGRPSLRQR